MKILIIGDAHLGKNQNIGKQFAGASLNSRVIDQFNILDWTLNEAVESCCNHIVMTGDVFEDPKPQIHIITSFMNWLHRCSDNGIKVHIVVGNHDTLRTGNFYYSPLDVVSEADIQGVHVYNSLTTINVYDDVSITFIPFRDRKSLFCDTVGDASEAIKSSILYESMVPPRTFTKIAVGHMAIEGSMPVGDELDDISNEIFLDVETLKSFDYTWMGHIHKPQLMCDYPLVAHIGSMDISNFGETDHIKHVVIFDCETKTYEAKNIPTRNLSKIEITIPNEIENTTQYVIDEIKKNLVDGSILSLSVNLETASLKSIDKKKIEQEILKCGAFGFSKISETKNISLVKKDDSSKISNSTDFLSAVKSYCENEEYVPKEHKDCFNEIINEIYLEFKQGNSDEIN
jgi:DNA repair exonuclease SbcCD nuclease subunit